MKPEQSDNQNQNDTYSADETQTSQAQSVEQEPATVAQEAPAEPFIPAKKSKKPLFAGIIAAVVLVVLLGGGALAYNVWYQNPDKVVGDSLMNILKAKTFTGDGDISASNKTVGFKMSLAHQNDRKQGHLDASLDITLKEQKTDVSLKGEAVYTEKGDVYVKVKDLQKSYDKFIDDYADSQTEQYESYGQKLTSEQKEMIRSNAKQQFAPIVEKVDNKWIKISADDLKDFDKDAGDKQACYTKAFEMIDKDDKATDEVMKAYSDNKFIDIKKELGSKDGSLGYKIDIDEVASNKFADEFDKTAIGKQLNSCDEPSDSSSRSSKSDDDSIKDSNVELWVTRWSHEVSKVNGSSTVATNGQEDDPTKIDFNYSPKFNEEVSVETPKDATPLKELLEDFKSLSTGSIGTPAATQL